MSRALHSLVFVIGLMVLGGCVVYEPVPMAQPSPQQRFDRSWTAAAGAMTDQGVTITSQDRGAGAIRGQRMGIAVTALVQSQADGGVQVSFETTGASGQDPDLTRRLRESFLRRMGR